MFLFSNICARKQKQKTIALYLLYCDTDRGRSRRKKRDFFGTIKRRLGRSRTRSKSVDPGERVENGEDQLTRSISADRMRDASAHSTGKHKQCV
jgi:hypothetical protein